MALQPIVGYPSSWRAPFTAVELNFAQGASTASGGPRDAIYIGPKLTSAAATVNTVYPMRNEQDAIDLFGVGSPLHRAVRKHFQANRLHKVYAMCYAPSSGSGVATATGTFTITFTTGSTPTAAGNLYFTVGPEDMTVSFTTADTATTIGDNIAAQINAKTWLGVTAANVTGVITVTSKVAGASSGDGTVGVIRIRASVDVGKNVIVATSGAALGLGTGTPGADGATTELTGLQAALAAIASTRYYYIGITAWNTAAVGALKTHLYAKNLPSPGIRCRGFSAYTGTQSALTTIAIGLNLEVQHVAWQLNSDHDPAELVANTLAVHQFEESTIGNFVEDYYRGPAWQIRPTYSASDRVSEGNVNDAVVDGIIVINTDSVGSFMVMSVSTRSKNAAGTIDDFRATETHRASFMHWLADTWQQRHQSKYAKFKLSDDAYKDAARTQLDPNGLPPIDKLLTPNRYRPFASDLITEFVNAGMLQRKSEWLDSLRINIDPLNVSRLEAGASGRTIDIAHQFSLKLNETTPG